VKPLDAQTHYEVLDVGRRAGAEEIERAYRIAREAFADGSVAVYSVFEANELGAIRERIESAYGVLSDPQARSRYDEALAAEPRDRAPRSAGESGAEEQQPAPAAVAERVEEEEQRLPFSALEDLEVEYEEQDWGGPGLRRARRRRGLEIEPRAVVSKISPTYLHFLEEESFDELPAPVYVRGFVTAYARAVGLDSQRVARSYMDRVESRRGTQRRGRLLGRK
jgi:flagellar biosynthesis protein FlhG